MLHIFHLFNCIRCVDTSCALSSPKNSLEKTKGKKQLHAHFCVQHNKNPNRRWKFDCGRRRGGRHATFGLRQRNLLLHSSQKREEKPRFNIFEHCQYASAAEGEFFCQSTTKGFFASYLGGSEFSRIYLHFPDAKKAQIDSANDPQENRGGRKFIWGFF